MHFKVLPPTARVSGTVKGFFLFADNWDDWFKYSTTYTLVYVDSTGAIHNVGQLKIGQFNMKEEQRRPELNDTFTRLSDDFFSVGQDESYYETIISLANQHRFSKDDLFRSLRDFSYDLSLFNSALNEEVTKTSLLRSVSPKSIREQFHRIAHGGARLCRYKFTYNYPGGSEGYNKFSFDVEPESLPPSNVHVLIGRNGVGKSRTLDFMIRALIGKDDEAGYFDAIEPVSSEDSFLFANLVSVSFSAFDEFKPYSEIRDKTAGIQYSYIGLKKKDPKDDSLKDMNFLARDFSQSLKLCIQGASKSRLESALKTLESDPIFHEASLLELIANRENLDTDAVLTKARRIFRKFSSGHKIALLTITRLVETVQEKSLVLLDEPEGHLHPPLLSAFIRALSNLLINRNGVAIVATHSPVILQEVPKSCVWKVRRVESEVAIERPECETFGESVGVLTREVFGLEVEKSGFLQMIDNSVKSHQSYEEVLEAYGGNLGSEAKGLARALLLSQERDV